MTDEEFCGDLIRPGREVTRHPYKREGQIAELLRNRRRVQGLNAQAREGIVLYAYKSVRSYLDVQLAMTIPELKNLYAIEEQSLRRKSMLTLVAKRIMLRTTKALLHRIRFSTVSKSSNRKGREAV